MNCSPGGGTATFSRETAGTLANTDVGVGVGLGAAVAVAVGVAAGPGVAVAVGVGWAVTPAGGEVGVPTGLGVGVAVGAGVAVASAPQARMNKVSIARAARIQGHLPSLRKPFPLFIHHPP